MARYTSAYSSFVGRLEEVDTLRRFAAAKERTDAIGLRNEINALCRGSIVLLSGHLEAYVKELGEIALESMTIRSVPRTNLASRFYYHISKDLIKEIKDTSDPQRIANKVFDFINSDLEFWSKAGGFPQPIPVGRLIWVLRVRHSPRSSVTSIASAMATISRTCKPVSWRTIYLQ